MVTNISFEAWADYLGDAPLAMAILNRLVDGAIRLKNGGPLLPRPSHRAARAAGNRRGPPIQAASQVDGVATRASSLFGSVPGVAVVRLPAAHHAGNRFETSPRADHDPAGAGPAGLRPHDSSRRSAPRPLSNPPGFRARQPVLLGESRLSPLPLLPLPLRGNPARSMGGRPASEHPRGGQRPLPTSEQPDSRSARGPLRPPLWQVAGQHAVGKRMPARVAGIPSLHGVLVPTQLLLDGNEPSDTGHAFPRLPASVPQQRQPASSGGCLDESAGQVGHFGTHGNFSCLLGLRGVHPPHHPPIGLLDVIRCDPGQFAEGSQTRVNCREQEVFEAFVRGCVQRLLTRGAE